MEPIFKDFAIDLAGKAGEIMRTNFALGMKREWKKDSSPLTETDKAINNLVINSIKTNYPDHSIIAEEGSHILKNSEYDWVCDPVDGTFPFSHGYPCFVFSLALTKNGEGILGVLYDPIMDRLFYAQYNEPTTLNNKTIRVSKQTNIKDSVIDCVSWFGARYDLFAFQRLNASFGGHNSSLMSVCYSASLVTCGEFIATIYPDKNPWDGAAVKMIVNNAGGKVTDLFGNEQRYDQEIKGFIASNGLVHDQIVELVQSSIRNTSNLRGLV
jgi:fructose-1,6-bisphosphatase/inositol monophosphatase family enzyme